MNVMTEGLPESGNEGKYVVIIKPNKDATWMSSYRCLIINKDFKIFASLLIDRLNKLIYKHILTDQASFFARRQLRVLEKL